MRLRLSIIFFTLLWLPCLADSKLDALISKGNRAYLLGQTDIVGECADSAKIILNNASYGADERADYSLSMLKLYGNYHYLNATQDTTSFRLAEDYYRRAWQIIADNPTTAFSGASDLLMLREFAQLYYRLERYDEALEALRSADERMEYMGQYELGGDDWLMTKMALALTLARLGKTDEALNIADTELAGALDKTGLTYARAQRMYGKIQMLCEASKSGALKAYKAYFKKQKDDAMANFGHMNAREREQYWLQLRPFIADCYRLEEADPAFLYDVTVFAKGLLLQLSKISGYNTASAEALKPLTYTYADIQKRLRPGIGAIEFIEYEKDGRTQMAALVLKATGKPEFVRMQEPTAILEIASHDISSTDRRGKDELYNNEKLQNMIWTPEILKSLSGMNRIYFAPDGYLHRLAIEYMPQVADKEMFRLTSTRRLLEKNHKIEPGSAMLLFGGINYDLNKAPAISGDNDSIAYANYRGTIFPILNSATDESKLIRTLRANPADSLVSGAMASEGAFRLLAPGYKSILVSTHGDFHSKSLPMPNDLKSVESDDAMSENVVAFAGVNSALRRDKSLDGNTFDGILSAREISETDLTGCSLFTMSACQTGLGKITSDGVYGLQRGLKNAGVGSMLLSLWSVSSEATAILMEEFYKNINTGMSVGKAFAQARQNMLAREETETISYKFSPATMAKKKVRKVNNAFNTPQFTNAFILIDAID